MPPQSGSTGSKKDKSSRIKPLAEKKSNHPLNKAPKRRIVTKAKKAKKSAPTLTTRPHPSTIPSPTHSSLAPSPPFGGNRCMIHNSTHAALHKSKHFSKLSLTTNSPFLLTKRLQSNASSPKLSLLLQNGFKSTSQKQRPASKKFPMSLFSIQKGYLSAYPRAMPQQPPPDLTDEAQSRPQYARSLPTDSQQIHSSSQSVSSAERPQYARTMPSPNQQSQQQQHHQSSPSTPHYSRSTQPAQPTTQSTDQQRQQPQQPQPLKPKKTVSGRPVYTPEEFNYTKHVLNRKLGELYQLNQPLPIPSSKDMDKITSPIQHVCTQISTADHSDVSIYSFQSRELPVVFKMNEFRQPHLHSTNIKITIPQHHHRIKLRSTLSTTNTIVDLNTYDPGTLGYHRFVLLQSILQHLLNSYLHFTHSATNPLALPHITIPLSPDNPIQIEYNTINGRDFNNSLDSIFTTLDQFSNFDLNQTSHKATSTTNLLYWFHNEILNLIPKSVHQTNQKRLRKFQQQLQGLGEQFNVKTDSGQVIDMNEGVQDPELVNKVITELGFNPRNITRDQLDEVYKEVEKRLEDQDLKLQDVFSDEEEVDDENNQDDDTESSDSEFAQHNKEELDQLAAITKKNVEKQRQKMAKGGAEDDDDDDDDGATKKSNHKQKSSLYDTESIGADDELAPQDPRLYHGILPQAAIAEMERVDKLDKEHAQKSGLKSLNDDDDDEADQNLKEYNTEQAIRRQKRKNALQQLQTEGEWVYSGKLYSELKQRVLDNPRDKVAKLQYHLLTTLDLNDVLEHFQRQFSPLTTQVDDNSTHPTQQYKPQSVVNVSGPAVQFPQFVANMSQKLLKVKQNHQKRQVKKEMGSISPNNAQDTSLTEMIDATEAGLSQSELITPQFPIVNINLPGGISLPSVCTKIKFHANMSFSDPMSSMPGDDLANIQNEANFSNPITNFDIPRRFALDTIDLDRLETFHGFSTITTDTAVSPVPDGMGQDDVIDVGVEDKSSDKNQTIHGNTTQSKYHGLDRGTWLRQQFQNKNKALLRHYTGDYLNLDQELQWNIVLLNTNTEITHDTTTSNIDMSTTVHNAYAALPKTQRLRVNAVLEHVAVQMIHRIIVDHLQNNQNVDNAIEIIPPSYLSQQPIDTRFNNISSYPRLKRSFDLNRDLSFDLLSRNNFQETNVISTVDTDIYNFVQHLVNIADSDQLNIFSFATLLKHTLSIQQEISSSINNQIADMAPQTALQSSLFGKKAGQSSPSSHGQNCNQLEDLILAKTFLPLLLFGTTPIIPDKVSLLTAASTRLHFDTLFKHYFVSNMRRSITLTSPEALALLPPTPQQDRQFIEENLTESTMVMFENQEEIDHQHQILKGIKKFINKLSQKEVLLNMSNLNKPASSSQQKLLPQDIIFDFEKHIPQSTPGASSQTPVSAATLALQRSTSEPQLTVRHLLGGQTYLPIPKNYNTIDLHPSQSDSQSTQKPTVNSKRDYETKWIATVKSQEQNNTSGSGYPGSTGGSGSNAKIAFDMMHDQGFLDCVVTSDLDHHTLLVTTHNTVATSTNTGVTTDQSHQTTNTKPTTPLTTKNTPNLIPDSDIAHEHTLNMNFTKLQQTLPSQSQLYIPMTKQLARPVYLTVDDHSSNQVQIEANIDHVEQRLTPHQMLLLPFIKFLFGKQPGGENSKKKARFGSSSREFGSEQIDFIQTLQQSGIDLSMDFTYTSNPNDPSGSQQVKCIIKGCSHVNVVDKMIDVLIDSLTKTDLTSNIVELLTDFSTSLTSSRQHLAEYDTYSNPSHLLAQGQETADNIHLKQQEKGQQNNHLYHNSTELSLYQAMYRLPPPPSSSTANTEHNYRATFMHLTKGVVNQQHLAGTLSALFTELNLKDTQNSLEHGPNMVSMGSDYTAKLQALPPFWRHIFTPYDVDGNSNSLMPSNTIHKTAQISPLLVLLVNDIAETLKCLLLGPIEEQFVHMSLPSQMTQGKNRPHPIGNNMCNNNYFTKNDSAIDFDPSVVLQDTTGIKTHQGDHEQEREIVDHDLFTPIGPQVSIPLPTTTSSHDASFSLQHMADPTYPNIYKQSQLLKDPNSSKPGQHSRPKPPNYGLSSIHLKTNKHTLDHPTLSTFVTSSVAKLINQTYTSQITAYTPEAALVGCFLHQDVVTKTVQAKPVVSSPVTQPNNHLAQGLTPLDLDAELDMDPVRVTSLNTTAVVPLLSVRNMYQLDPNKTTPPTGKDMIRISQHGVVGFVEGIAFDTIEQQSNGTVSTHITAENFLKSQTKIAQDANNQQVSPATPRTDGTRGTAGNITTLRPNQFIVAPTSSTTTTIAFSAQKLKPRSGSHTGPRTVGQSDDLNSAILGLTFLGQMMLQHTLENASANVLHANSPPTGSNGRDQGFDDFVSYLSHFHQRSGHGPIKSGDTNPQPVSIKAQFNPIDGVFAIQQVKDHTVPMMSSQAGGIAVSDRNGSVESNKSSLTHKQLQHLRQFNDCDNFVEALRLFSQRFIDHNIDNHTPPTTEALLRLDLSSSTGSTTKASRLTFDNSTFDLLKLQLLTTLQAQSSSTTATVSTDGNNYQSGIDQQAVGITSLQSCDITPAMIATIRSATPSQVCQIFKTTLNYPKSRVSVVGPLEDVPEQLESDAKTTNGKWSLHVL